MQRCLIILGAPRTGSSCLSGCIHACGIDLGKSLSAIKDRHNEKGYFENEAVLNFNRSLFSILGLKWHDRDLTPEEVAVTLGSKHRLVQILEDDYLGEDCAIKDFRLGIFSDVYKLAFSEIGVDVKAIVIRREMQSVIASMKKMFGWQDDAKAIWMYNRCYQLFDNYSYPRLDVSFEDLVAQPLSTVDKICSFAGFDFGAESQQRVIDFVEKGLVHEDSVGF